MTPSYWQEAVSFLHRQDEIISQLITAYPHQTLNNTHHNPFETLTLCSDRTADFREGGDNYLQSIINPVNHYFSS